MFLKKLFCCECFGSKKKVDKELEVVKVEDKDKELEKEIKEGVLDSLPDPLEPYLTLKKQGESLKEIYGSVDDFVYALFYLKA